MNFNFDEIFSQEQDTFFGENIIHWYHTHKRDLAWRNTKNPYFIWLSEIILQQTRVIQGTPYYLKFVENYPKVEDLANAPINEVLRLWQGLGYYARARNMHATAKIVVEQFGGIFPDNFQTLQTLKGVGHYTASAVCV
jgi:A/G-specific adenine glycosylase